MTNPERKVETGTDELLCTVSEGMATITLNPTQAHNLRTDNSSPALRTMIRHHGYRIEVGAIIVTGATRGRRTSFHQARRVDRRP